MDRQVMTHAQWVDWKNHPVTRALLDEMIQQVESEIQTLVLSAGLNPATDRYSSGKIAGIGYIADWKPQLVEDSDEI